jgi:isopentenyl phosphate kinase
MKRTAFILAALIFAGAGSVAHAQATQKKATIDPRDSVSVADVQRAADELARTVQEVVRKVTEDPKLKVAALNLAKESVNAAQVIVAQQAVTLQSVLETLAKQVAAATETIQQSKPKTH